MRLDSCRAAHAAEHWPANEAGVDQATNVVAAGRTPHTPCARDHGALLAIEPDSTDKPMLLPRFRIPSVYVSKQGLVVHTARWECVGYRAQLAKCVARLR